MVSKHKVCEKEQLEETGSRVIVEVDGEELAVFNVEGKYHALPNYCVHQSGPLCEGELTGQMAVDGDGMWEWDEEEKIITCPWHAWKFDVTTGKNIRDKRYTVPQYEVKVEKGNVYVLR